MDEPPFLIDRARVLAHATLRHGIDPPMAAGVPLDNATAAAVTENLADGAVFLLYCDDDWQTLAAESHASKSAAQEAARSHNPAIEWRDYRSLSDAEHAEIETTRAFLREIARDFPGGA